MLRVEVFTDGSCLNNGTPNAKAGFGVFWPQFQYLSKSGQVHKGPQTSNVAELAAIFVALDEIEKSIDLGDHFTLWTDSQYAYNCLNTWYSKWKRNGWKTAERRPVQNRELIEEVKSLYDNLQAMGKSIEIKICRGHVSSPEGAHNAEADKLARQGAAGQRTAGQASCYLDTEHSEVYSGLLPSSSASALVSAYTEGSMDGRRWGGCVLFYGEGDARNVYTKTDPMKAEIVELIAIDQALIEFQTRDIPSRLVPGTLATFNVMWQLRGGNLSMARYDAQSRKLLEGIKKKLDTFEAEGRQVLFGLPHEDDDFVANSQCKMLADEVSRGSRNAKTYKLR